MFAFSAPPTRGLISGFFGGFWSRTAQTPRRSGCILGWYWRSRARCAKETSAAFLFEGKFETWPRTQPLWRFPNPPARCAPAGWCCQAQTSAFSCLGFPERSQLHEACARASPFFAVYVGSFVPTPCANAFACFYLVFLSLILHITRPHPTHKPLSPSTTRRRTTWM